MSGLSKRDIRRIVREELAAHHQIHAETVQSLSTPWLSPADVAARIPGMTIANLQELRKKGVGPAYHKPTLKTVVYSEADVDEWVSRSRVRTREQA